MDVASLRTTLLFGSSLGCKLRDVVSDPILPSEGSRLMTGI